MPVLIYLLSGCWHNDLYKQNTEMLPHAKSYVEPARRMHGCIHICACITLFKWQNVTVASVFMIQGVDGEKERARAS